MNLITNSKFYFLLITALFVISNVNQSFSQDLFGSIPSSPTSYTTSSTMSTSGDIYITIWGSGVFKSNNKGDSWTPLNTGLTNFNLTNIEFISSSEILVSTMGGGIFKTTSLTNVVWKPVNNGLSNLDVRSIKLYPTGMIVVGTYGDGIFISKDKGETWKQSNKGFLYKDVTTIEVADNGWIVAGTYGGGVFQSRDTAKTWSKQSSGLKNLFINDIKRNKNDYLYAATNGRGVYISVNDGIAWAELDTFMTRPLKINPVPLPDLNATKLTFSDTRSPIFGSRYGGIYADDQVEDFTWVPTSIRGQGVNSLIRDKDSIYGFFPALPTYRSKTTGEVWKQANADLFNSITQNLKVLSLKDKEIIAYKLNSIKKTTDEGLTWTNLASTPTNINKITRDSSGNFYAATEKGLYMSDASMSNWNAIKSLDTNVLDVEIAPNGTIYIATHFYLPPQGLGDPIDIRRVYYKRVGSNWATATINFDTKVPRPHDIAINYDGTVHVAGGDVVFFSKNDGSSWFKTSVFESYVSSIGFFSNGDVIIGTLGSGIFHSANSLVFTKFDNYPASSISIINVGMNDVIYSSGQNIFVDPGFGTVEATYMTTDKGETFVNINNNFNNEAVMSFTVNNKNDLYMSTVSGMIYRAISADNLTTPTQIELADKTVDVDVNSQFSWTSTNRAELYQLEITYDEEFDYISETVTQKDTSHLLHNPLLPNHKYYWRVRSKNHDAVSDWSAVRTFYSKLATPELNSPANKAINIPVYANLIWHKVEDATKYLIQLSKTTTFDKIEHEWESSDTTSRTALLEGRTNYYWRVKALNETLSSNWSIVWSFETVFGPPILLSPENNAIGVVINPQMTWQIATDVTEYDIQIAEDSDFTTLAFEGNSIVGTSVMSSVLLYDLDYFWRVRSRKGDVYSEWSLVFKFRTGYNPIKLLYPADGSTNITIQPDLIWEADQTQTTYQYEISKLADFTTKVFSGEIENSLTVMSDSLEPYQEYYWRARVVSVDNNGIWANANKFKTSVAQIKLRFPLDNSLNHPISLRFQWYATVGAKSYHLQIANDIAFNDLIFSQDTITNIIHQFNELNAGSDHYWRVRAVSNEGVGPWSSVWKFTTGNNIPVLVSPENGQANVSNPITFRWNQVAGALHYQINVSENSDFMTSALSESKINGIIYTTSVLEFPKTYYWRIRATTPEGTSSWSQVWSFGTKDPTSVQNSIAIEQSSVYPNPANNIVNILIPQLIGETAELLIADISGRKITSSNVQINDGVIEWNSANSANGLYFITIKSNGITYTGEVLIQK